MTSPTDDTQRGVTRKTLVAVLATLSVISTGWFIFLYVRGVEQSSLDMEFAKALLQVGIVSVAATVLSLLVFGYQHRAESDQRAREQRREQLRKTEEAARSLAQLRDDLLKGTLARLTASYNNTKRARRRMRALGLDHRNDGVFTRLRQYDECMADINDAQLDIETIKSDVKTSYQAYPSANRLVPCVRSMDEYLGELIEEYELTRGQADLNTSELSLVDLPRFADFLGRSKISAFYRKFSGAQAEARAAVRNDLLHPSFSSSPNIDTLPDQKMTAM